MGVSVFSRRGVTPCQLVSAPGLEPVGNSRGCERPSPTRRHVWRHVSGTAGGRHDRPREGEDMSTYTWIARAFKHDGRCDICEKWTKAGVRLTGRRRWRHLCLDCAKNRFAGEIVMVLWYLRDYAKLARPNTDEAGWIALKFSCTPAQAQAWIFDARRREREGEALRAKRKGS